MPSSWILRVSVLRPQPSRRAASMRCPPVCASARRISARLELVLETVADVGLAARRAPAPARGPAPRASRRPRRRAPRHPAHAPPGEGRPTSTRWPGAITVSQWQMFSSCRTLPGNANVASAFCASSDSTFGSTARSRALFCRKCRASGPMSSRTLAQRRQAHADDVETVQQVLAEQALPHALLEVLVRGGDDPHVRPLRRVPADAVVLAVRQHAQQPHLQVRRHVADLVQEQRAAVGLLEAAAARRLGAGERAALVAEQLRLQQVLRDRGGVDRHERSGGARDCGGAVRARPAPCRCPTRR